MRKLQPEWISPLREVLNGEIFYSLREAQILIEQWCVHYNTVRLHSALGYRPPAPESVVPIDQRPTMHLQLNRTTRWGHAKFRLNSAQKKYGANRAANVIALAARQSII